MDGLQFLIPHISTVVFASIVVLAAGFIRGYSGFGFAMITIVGLSLILVPVQVVPVVLLLDITASALLLPKAWRSVDWRALVWLTAGVILGTPFGVLILTWMPVRPMRAFTALVIIFMVVPMWRGFRLHRRPGRAATSLTGLASGLLNGAAAIGGPPVILFFYSSKAGLDISRASLIAFFLFTDILASGVCLSQGLITTQTLGLTGLLLIPLYLGILAGSRSFIKTEQETFRKRVMMLLLALSIISLIRSIFG